MKRKINLPKLIQFLKRFFNIVITGFAIVVLLGLVLPSKWQVQRSQIINTTPAQIYAYLSKFNTSSNQWSTFDTGNGVLVMTKTDAKTGIEFKLHMVPDHFSMTGEIKLESLRHGTKVTWTNRGDVGGNIFFKYMALMSDKEMGKSLEESLKNLQKLVEKKS